MSVVGCVFVAMIVLNLLGRPFKHNATVAEKSSEVTRNYHPKHAKHAKIVKKIEEPAPTEAAEDVTKETPPLIEHDTTVVIGHEREYVPVPVPVHDVQTVYVPVQAANVYVAPTSVYVAPQPSYGFVTVALNLGGRGGRIGRHR